MGIEVDSYTTESGFVVSPAYLNVTSFRLLICADGAIQCAFGIQLYKSREDKHAGRSPIVLPISLSTAETFIVWKDLYRQSLFGIAYAAAKARWQAEGYVVNDVYEPGQPTPTQYTYDLSGYNIDGFNSEGYDADGYDREGYDHDGYNASGYDQYGYNRDGYDASGFDRDGYDHDGYDRMGFNRDGWDRDGFGRDGYNAQGLDRNGNPRPTMNMSTMSTMSTMSSMTVVDLSGSSTE
jgi:hypothetical protein